MAEGIVFEINEKNEGRFIFPDEYGEHYLELYDLLLMHDETDRVDRSFLLGLRKIIKSAPDFIDAYVRIANYYYDRGDYTKSNKEALAAVAIANRVIPENFAGTIDFENIDNRPYFRAMEILIDIAIQRQKHTDAIFLIDKLIAFDNLDHLGLSNRLGSELLRAGDLERAKQVFKEEAQFYSPYHYEMALLHLFQEDYVQAATSLRIGFALNPILASIIYCKYLRFDRVWENYSADMVELSLEYVGAYQSSWRWREGKAFFMWLYQHSKVMEEQTFIRSYAERLFAERNSSEPDERKIAQMRHQVNEFIEAIDDTLSTEIIKAIRFPNGHLEMPWRQSAILCQMSVDESGSQD